VLARSRRSVFCVDASKLNHKAPHFCCRGIASSPPHRCHGSKTASGRDSADWARGFKTPWQTRKACPEQEATRTAGGGPAGSRVMIGPIVKK
jgi:hypothetical protein